MANMIASFFSMGCDSEDVFKKLQIARDERYKSNLNQYPVIHISFNDTGEGCTSYSEY